MAAEAKPFQLETLLQQVALLMGDKVETKGLELFIEVQPQVPNALIGDQMRLRQILVNLVNNAVKFTDKGEIHIKVSASELAGDQLELRFEVRDSGIGMSREQLRNLCFESLSGATNSGSGSGLGLVVSKRLAELMGGAVGVNSAIGLGSSFRFTACLRCDPAADQTQHNWSALARWSKPALADAPTNQMAQTPGDPALAVLHRLDGIDLDKGLAYMSGKVKLYIKLLRRFVELQSNDVARIREALAQEDRGQAKRIAHTLKSTVGSLGAVQLQAVASALEQVLDAQHPLSEVTALLNSLEQKMVPLLETSLSVLAELDAAAADAAAT